MDVARRQLDRRLDRVGRVADVVVLLERGAQAGDDLDRVLDRRLVDVDLLEPAQQRAVLFEMVAELLVGGRADAADRARGERGLQQVRRVHRPAAGRAGADHRVDLVDEQDRVGQLLKLGDDRLQPLLEVAAIAGAGEQRAHVERVDHRFLEHVGHVALDDLAREALRRWRSCRRRDRRHRAGCSSTGGRGSAPCGRPRACGRSADRPCRPWPCR